MCSSDLGSPSSVSRIARTKITTARGRFRIDIKTIIERIIRLR